MKVHEYQAKQVLAAAGVAVPRGRVAQSPAEARRIAEELGGRVVVKAQIHAGGRGKGGGVKLADNPAQAEQVAGQIIGMQLITHQTRPEGQKVKSVLVEEAMANAQELYLGIVLDRAAGLPVIMASASGGMDIEEVAARDPDAILRVHVDPTVGFQPSHGRRVAYGLGLTGDQARQAAGLVGNLYRAFWEKDCSLAEVNPLVVTEDGRVLALDAKLNFDDSALARHPDLANLRDLDEEDPLEVRAADAGVNYVKLDGNIGCMVNGAGLAMATMDIIKLAGGEPANFLDVGGGASAEQVAEAFRILVSDPNVKGILINIFGGILRGDVLAEGVISGARSVGVSVPIVVRLTGTNAAEGMKMLEESGLNIQVAADLKEAAERAVAAIK
jgi:succinyl-CoA synthetase beta subunit